MHVAILAAGSRGDIQPMVAVAMEFCRRGHSVALTTNENFVEWIGPRPFEVLSLPLDSEAYLRSPAGREMLATGKLVELFKHLAQMELEANDALIEVFTRAVSGATLVLSTGLTILRGGILAERFGLAHRSLFLQPTIPTRAFPHYAFPLSSLGLGPLNCWSHSFVFSQVWRELAAAHNAMRESLGLVPWTRKPSETKLPSSINLFSPELLPRPKDWGAAHQVVGFAPLRPSDRNHPAEAQVLDALDTWLDAGEPPIYFGFGSMPVYHPHQTLSDIQALCERLGTRALIGAGWTDYGPGSGNDTVFIATALDHDRVLPRCRAAVHHGGAGTTHTALRAGLPSLVCWFSVDQPFWGRRLKRLGVGDVVPFRTLNLRALTRHLPPLLDERTQARAAQIGARLRQEDGARRAVDLVEAAGIA